MGRIANLQMSCPHYGKTTNIYVEESNTSSAEVMCQHCKKIFEFGSGMLYNPIGYVPEIPEWAKIKAEAKES
jgi:hypothetical protein